MKTRIFIVPIAALLFSRIAAYAQLSGEFNPPRSNCCLANTAKSLADQLQDWNQLGRYYPANEQLKKQPPEPIDQHAGDERVLPRDHPAGQVQPRCARAFYVELAQELGNRGRDDRPGIVLPVAARHQRCCPEHRTDDGGDDPGKHHGHD